MLALQGVLVQWTMLHRMHVTEGKYHVIDVLQAKQDNRPEACAKENYGHSISKANMESPLLAQGPVFALTMLHCRVL